MELESDCRYRVTHLSSVAARMYFPLGENFTNDTGGLSSSKKNDNKHIQHTHRAKYHLNTSYSVTFSDILGLIK